MKRQLREAFCTCTSARSLLYQSLLVHKPNCMLCKALLSELHANVWTHEVIGFMVSPPTALENRI